MIKVNYISCEDLLVLISKNNDFCIIDVRSKAEFNEKHILGSSSIPRSDLEFQLPRLIPYKNLQGYFHYSSADDKPSSYQYYFYI